MKPQPPANDELIDRTRALWEPRLGRDLTREEARRMIAEVAGFFGVLADWAHAEATAAANDTPRSLQPPGPAMSGRQAAGCPKAKPGPAAHKRPGFRAHVHFSDAEYFNLRANDARIAKAHRSRPSPSIPQIRHVLAQMPQATAIQRRDRALVAFTLLSGARDGAIASFRVKHVDIAAGRIEQDAREVHTKRRKTFTTVFFPVGDDIRDIVCDWVRELTDMHLFGPDDPLFPSTHIGADEDGLFRAEGLSRQAWRSAGQIRAIFKAAFEATGLPYFNPHSFRKTLTALGQTRCRTPEEYKAWSQNIGHEGVLTTFASYGEVSAERQAEILRLLDQDAVAAPDAGAVARLVEAAPAMKGPANQP